MPDDDTLLSVEARLARLESGYNRLATFCKDMLLKLSRRVTRADAAVLALAKAEARSLAVNPEAIRHSIASEVAKALRGVDASLVKQVIEQAEELAKLRRSNELLRAQVDHIFSKYNQVVREVNDDAGSTVIRMEFLDGTRKVIRRSVVIEGETNGS